MSDKLEDKVNEIQLEARTNTLHIKQILDMFGSHKQDIGQKIDGVRSDVKELISTLMSERARAEDNLKEVKEGFHARRTEENTLFTQALERIKNDLKPIKESYDWLTNTKNFLVKVPLIGAGLVFIASIIAKAFGIEVLDK